MSKVMFNEKLQTYEVNNIPVPRVTKLFDNNFDGIPPIVLAKACERGDFIHKACEKWDKEHIFWGDYVDYVCCWIDYQEKKKIEILEIERMVYSEKYMFAGTIDRLIKIDNKVYVLDLKATAKMSPYTGLQLAGYQLALKEMGYKVNGRLGVLLRNGKPAEPTYFKDKNDINIFKCYLAIYKWKQKENLIK